MAKSETAEVRPSRLRLRNFKLRAAMYRRLATLIERGQGKRAAMALRRMADELEVKK